MPRFLFEPDDRLEFMQRQQMFQDPGGRSALRRATKSNPRIYPCPTCKEPNKLTAADVGMGYQCNDCADAAEFGC